MNRFRTLTLVAAPAAMLIGLAAPAVASDTPGPDTPATVSSSAPVKVQAKTWHWMGNYGSVYDAANAANGFGAGAGEFLTQNVNGQYATFMYY
ncbi:MULTISPECIES: hypothetical protein [Streptomyces]|uniref:Chitinase n=1 Tax=Streptomyces griseocarneus TaxID=51201 RepID=A0ABX7RPQ8_9ACTN|nr:MULTISPECIES: hypothetical protein [Streptomyces]QSY49338.1 hypothetical protein J3S04_31145 [Streptomyces griseocarneus]